MFGAIGMVVIIMIIIVIIMIILIKKIKNTNSTDNNNNDPIFTCHKVRSLRENRSTNRGHLENYSLGLK